jgi:DNA-directed RNA polymerase II subunit RPB2
VRDNRLAINAKVLAQIDKKEIRWFNLLTNSNAAGDAVVEYLDPMEEENSFIAMDESTLMKADETKNYSHCEIHPSMMLGISVSTTPFSNHNQAPRNEYQAAQVKQSLGIYAGNFNDRFDKIGHVLHYPQRPLVPTRSMKYFHFEEIPGGINAIIAIATYSGYNQEDSLIFNKGALERNLFTSTYYATIKDDLSKGNKEYGKPDPNNTVKLRKNISFRHISEDGFIKKETMVEPNDVIIGKIQKTDKTSQTGDGKQLYTDESITLADMGVKDKYVVVDNVIVSQNGEGYPFCKVRLRKNRIPIIGDKFCARHGQKGTIGMTMANEDMPFTRDGIVPDLIMNPHAIPSRMTIGQLLEVVYDKVAAITGRQYDGTPFSGQSVETIGDELQKLGFERYGNEVLYNGTTGEQMDYDIFIGPCYYQKLKHMVSDKIHSRSVGPVSLLTRQPLEGRSKSGGLRLGEMERDALIAAGLTSFLKEKFFDASDGATAKGLYTVIICKTCGFFAQANKQANEYRCRHPDCIDKNNQYAEVYMPYACKLFFQELQSMCISVKMIVNEPSI